MILLIARPICMLLLLRETDVFAFVMRRKRPYLKQGNLARILPAEMMPAQEEMLMVPLLLKVV